MELTHAQQSIVKQLCDIQSDECKELFLKMELGNTSEGQPYEEFFEELNMTRDEWDDQLIETITTFQDVSQEPGKLFELFDEIDVEVFDYMLILFRDTIENELPKAYNNLKHKVDIWRSLNTQRS